MKVILQIFVASVCCFFCLSAKAQTQHATTSPVIDRLVSHLQDFNEQLPQEKVYLHTDGEDYVTGESVWLKAYVLDATTHLPLNLSKVLYVSLLSEKNEVVAQQKLKIDEGFTYSDIYLPNTLSTGHYTLKAHTLWMSNFTKDLYFTKTLRIYNPKDPWITRNRERIRNESFDLRFFPEGGELVANLPNRVAFKATDAQGRSIALEAAIVDELGQTVAQIATEHRGMGAFVIAPEPRKVYYAVVNTENFGEVKVPLPRARMQGLALRVDPLAARELGIRIMGTAAYHNQELYLLAQSGGQIHYAATGRLSGARLDSKISLSQLPHGLTHLTWFDQKGRPVAERLIFLDKEPKTETTIRGIQARYNTRQQVALQLQVKDTSGSALSGHYSVAVRPQYDNTALATNGNIYDYLMLRSELKGEIEEPGYYFNKQNQQAAEHLDLLLMTQGWRRFVWQELARGVLPEIQHSFEQNLVVQGKVTAIEELPRDSMTVGIFFLGQREVYEGQADETGLFEIPVFDFFGQDSIVVHVMNGTRPVRQFGLSLPKLTRPNGLLPRRYMAVTDNWRQYSAKIIAQQAFASNYQYYLPDRKDFSLARPYQNPFVQVPGRRFSNGSNFDFNMDEYVLLDNMRETLRELITGVKVSGRKNETRFTIFDPQSNDYFEEIPLLIIDGMPSFEQDKILNLRPEYFKRIEVLEESRYTQSFGTMGRHGVLKLETRDKALKPADLSTTRFAQFAGFYAARQYYTPIYPSQASREAKIPDFRQLLYWNPLLESDSNGNTDLEFYTSDISGTFVITIEGVTATGKPVTTQAILRVEEEQP